MDQSLYLESRACSLLALMIRYFNNVVVKIDTILQHAGLLK
jgi:hypothetical protein